MKQLCFLIILALSIPSFAETDPFEKATQLTDTERKKLNSYITNDCGKDKCAASPSTEGSTGQ